MAQRVVKLKPDKAAPGPAIRLSRAGNGFGFIVTHIDKNGTADFRTESEHNDFESALKEAEYKVRQHRLPLRNDTGVEIEKPTAPTAKAVKGAKSSVPSSSPVTEHESLDDLPLLSEQFRLPAIDDRIVQIEQEPVLKRSAAMHREARDEYRAYHAEIYGSERDHTVAYSQRLHDQIQGQISSLYTHALTTQVVLYTYLEQAFDRIEQLERNALTVDSFDAQVADDDRTIELAFGNGEQRKVASFKWPVPIYRGTHKSGQRYEAGDMVTAEGSGWIAQRTTTAKPGDPNSGFQLAIKRGRNGKDAHQ
jgi:hypothetical protein